MLSLQGEWICFRNRPLICVNTHKRILSSGCGQTHILSSGGEHPRLRDLIRLTHYRPVSHWVSESAARVVLQGGHQDQGTILHLTSGHEDCLLRIDGLPWDHNRLVFHLAHLPAETTYGGFDRFSAPDAGEGELGKCTWPDGLHTIWANSGHMAPLTGYLTSGGFWLSVRSGALSRFRINDGKLDAAGISENTLEVWDASATLRMGLATGLESGFHCLMEDAQDSLAAPVGSHSMMHPVHPAPVPVMMSGGSEACEKKASEPAPAGMKRMLVIEDWQGLKRTLLSSTPNCSWRSDPDRYNHLADLVGRLQASGHLCACNVLPYVNLESEMHREASVRGYCLMAQNGHEYEDHFRENPVVWIDLTQPKAVAWMQEQIRLLVQTYKFSGFLSTVDVPFPVKAAAANGNALTLRNRWASLWFEVCLNAFEQDSAIVVLPHG